MKIEFFRSPDTRARVKRIADFLEKLSAASLIVALFQESWIGFVYCGLFLFLSLWLTRGNKDG